MREPVALDRSCYSPRSVAQQATFLGETEPRAARPLGASPRVRQLGAIRGLSTQSVTEARGRCRSGPAVGVRDVERPGPCQARRDRGRHEEGLPNLRCADGNRDRRERDFGRVSGTLSHMLNHDYLAQTLRRPLPTKDGGTLHTVADAANHIVALPEDRRRSHWDRTVQLLLDMADPSEISRQLELALFYDRQLDLRTRTSTYCCLARVCSSKAFRQIGLLRRGN